jgi:hypothetical protein
MIKCCAKKCKADASYEAIILVHPKGYFKPKDDYEPAKVSCGAFFCEVHKDLDAFDILSDDDWVKISLTFFKKKAQHPDPERIDIEWTRL